MSEAIIRQRIDEVAAAIRAKDLGRVMAVYAPDIVSFDITPPLRYAGAERKRRAWQDVFAAYATISGYDLREATVIVDGELALVHSLNHIAGTLVGGHTAEMWLRWTACFRRIDGAWLIVHDHVSVPADLEHRQAAVNLVP